MRLRDYTPNFTVYVYNAGWKIWKTRWIGQLHSAAQRGFPDFIGRNIAVDIHGRCYY